MRFAEKRRMSVSQVLQSHTQKELYLWQAWERREITDNQKIERLLAQGLALFINLNTKKGSQKSDPNDFIFKSDWLPDEQSDSQTLINEFIKGMK